MSLLELFCSVDDFCQEYARMGQGKQLGNGKARRQRRGELHLSEIMTIVIHFHQSHYRDFKAYYTEHVQVYLRREFPKLVSYTRFVELMPRTLTLLALYVQHCLGQCTGLSFIDSTSLVVCHNRRIHSHRVFEGIAERGKTSVGWFYGFKLHLVVNDCGDLLAFCLTTGNVDDRQPVPKLARKLFGKLFGDKGYISQKLFNQLFADQSLPLIAKLRKNMKGQLMLYTDRLLLRRRAIIETVNDQLKNISQIEPTRHRSPLNFLVNLVAGLIAYCWQPKKPSLGIIRQADLVRV
jgi:hypothetical protein